MKERSCYEFKSLIKVIIVTRETIMMIVNSDITDNNNNNNNSGWSEGRKEIVDRWWGGEGMRKRSAFRSGGTGSRGGHIRGGAHAHSPGYGYIGWRSAPFPYISLSKIVINFLILR